MRGPDFKTNLVKWGSPRPHISTPLKFTTMSPLCRFGWVGACSNATVFVKLWQHGVVSKGAVTDHNVVHYDERDLTDAIFCHNASQRARHKLDVKQSVTEGTENSRTE